MLLHLATLLERKWPLLSQEARGKADLADVMDKATQEGTFAIVTW
jgi:hypothetical protein